MKKIVSLIIALIIFSACGRNKSEQIAMKVPNEDLPIYMEPMEEVKSSNGSLWSKSNESIYSDNKGRDVGDIVIILIREQASAQQSSSDNRNKSGKLDAKAGTGLLNILPEFGAEGSSNLKNNGTSSRSGSLQATVSSRVMKKDRFGNLYIVGKRKVLINNELQEIEISGYVRSEDIQIDNSVESTYLANAEVTYNGKLVFDGKTEPGKISNFLSGIVGFFF